MKKKILIVEDTADLLENLTDCLEMVGYETWPTRNARQALALLAGAVPDLMITDLMMSDVSGMELVQEIKRQPRLENIPIIIFSAKPLFEYRQQALAAGVNGFIQKPCALEEIYATIKKILPA